MIYVLFPYLNVFASIIIFNCFSSLAIPCKPFNHFTCQLFIFSSKNIFIYFPLYSFIFLVRAVQCQKLFCQKKGKPLSLPLGGYYMFIVPKLLLVA